MRTRVAACALALVTLLAACGDDDAKGKGVGSRRDGGGDASVEAGVDGAVRPLPPDLVVESDAGTDAGRDGAQVTPPMPPRDSGPPPTCADVDCSTLTDDCNVGVCVEATLECIAMPLPDGSACGDTVRSLCSAPDTCLAGVCQGNHQPAGRPCGDQDVVCRNDDECDGNGHCTDNGLWAVGTACGDSTDGGVCNQPDSCDAAGNCNPRHATRGTSCGDKDVPCHFDDECDGNGACIEGGLWDQGELCGGPTEPALGTCHPARYICNATGSCLNLDLANGSSCGSTTDNACDNPDSCLNGVCAKNYEPRGVACGDPTETDCDKPDFCNGFGNCSPGYEPLGTVCGTQSNPCVMADACDGGGACSPAGNVANGTLCGSTADTECDNPDRCQNGVCQPNYAAAGAPCGDQGVDCRVNDQCNGTGACSDKGLKAPGSLCGDQGRPCRFNDQCDASGACIDNGLWSQGTACGDATDRGICDAPDSCDAAGTCLTNIASAGVVCGDDAVACLEPDTCSGSGSCNDNGVVVGCRRGVVGYVTDNAQNPIEGATVTVLGISNPDVATSAADGSYTLEVPIGEPFLLHATSATARWDSVEERFVGDVFDLGIIALSGDSFIDAIFSGVGGHPAVDTSKGVVIFDFEGTSGLGGESGSQTAASATPQTPIVMDSSNAWVSSTELVAGGGEVLVFGNTVTGTTTVSVAGASGVNTCELRSPSLASRPVIAHTTTWIVADCTPL